MNLSGNRIARPVNFDNWGWPPVCFGDLNRELENLKQITSVTSFILDSGNIDPVIDEIMQIFTLTREIVECR
jgi:hypothetical protein